MYSATPPLHMCSAYSRHKRRFIGKRKIPKITNQSNLINFVTICHISHAFCFHLHVDLSCLRGAMMSWQIQSANQNWSKYDEVRTAVGIWRGEQRCRPFWSLDIGILIYVFIVEIHHHSETDWSQLFTDLKWIYITMQSKWKSLHLLILSCQSLDPRALFC